MVIRFLFCFFMLGAIAFPAHAVVNVTIAEDEKPIFAFFRLIERIPDFEYWVKNSSRYMKTTTKESRDFAYDSEMRRLQWGFGNYDEKKDFLKIRAPVDLSLSKDNAGNHRLHFTLVGFENSEFPFFPFSYGQMSVALLIKDLERFNNLKISDVNYKRVSAHFEEQDHLRAYVKIRIRPLSADISEPIVIDDTHFWGLSGDIAYFSYELEDAQRLVSYTAPWYLSKSENELLNLLGE